MMSTSTLTIANEKYICFCNLSIMLSLVNISFGYTERTNVKKVRVCEFRLILPCLVYKGIPGKTKFWKLFVKSEPGGIWVQLNIFFGLKYALKPFFP